MKRINLVVKSDNCTLLKKPSGTQDQNTRVTENSIIHVERSEKSVNIRDWASISIWVTEFSVTLVLWSCVTLGFSNSVKRYKKWLQATAL
jgi:hypothetical protein